MRLLLALLIACADPSHPAGSKAPRDSSPRPAGETGPSGETGPDSADPSTPPWSDDACQGLDLGDDPFAADIAAFADDTPPTGGLLAVGSSTIRRWRTFQRSLSAFDPLQRGIGGARLTDLIQHQGSLLHASAPAGLLLFAGTNDIADGRSVEAVLQAWRCLAQGVLSQPHTPILYTIGITPTPARWALWESAAAFNAEVARLSALHPRLRYIDSPAPFLATGSPPSASLFVEDGLHLSEAGYQLFTDSVLTALAGDLPLASAPLAAGPPAGSYIRVDLGPTNPEDGLPAPSIDGVGIHWNTAAWATGGAQILAGRARRGLVTTTGLSTQVSLTVSGGLRSNGLRNGGLTTPDGALLGTLAVPEATADFVYSGDPDDPAGLTLGGLDPAATYTLRLFASRATEEERRTSTFTVYGSGDPVVGSLLTSGADVGSGGYDGNNNTVLVLTGLRPDARGRLHLEMAREGAFLYLNLLELETAG
jgi:hypothetical protein